MAENVIGWIEIDEAAPDLGAVLQTAPRQLGTWNFRRNHRLATDPVTPTRFAATEYLAADVQQLQADLAAEFAQLLRRTRAK